MFFILRLVINALIIIGITYLVPGISVSSFYAALLVAVILGLINAIIRPLIIILTLPVNILSLGFFTLIINALLFWLVATIVKGFSVEGFMPAFWGALLLWLASWLTSGFIKSIKR
ncbi:MAG: phage holin family protein [Patescibacteria group bacterium]